MKAGFWEILLIVILVLVLFGHNKIPDLMKNLANGINVFKKELKGDETNGTERKAQSTDNSVAKSAASVKPVAKKSSAKKVVAKPVAKKPVAKKIKP